MSREMPYADKERDRAYKKEYSRKWVAKYPEKTRSYSVRWRMKYPEKALLNSAKVRSKMKGLPFSITLEDIVIPDVCPVLGIPIIFEARHGCTQRNRPNSPSLDRIIAALGYVPGNVQVISWRANDLKKDGTAAELMAVAEFVAKQDS